MDKNNKKIDKIMQKIEVDDFGLKDMSKLNFWLSMVEKYSYDKIVSICLRAGTTSEIAEKIAGEIDSNFTEEEKTTITMSEIRKLIFTFLYKYDWASAKRFKTEDIYIRTSSDKFEIFDRSKISRSLIKETGISEEQADGIAMDIEKFIKNLNLSYLSSPLIREIVNVKLLEYGLEDARKKYTRIGIPIYDVEQMIAQGVSTDIKRENANLQHTPETISWIISGETLEQYATLKLFPQNLVDSHISGDYHIHILSNAATRPNCIQHLPSLFFKHGLKVDGTGMHTSVAGPAKHLSVAIQHCAKILLAAQSVTYDEPLIFRLDGEIKIEQIGFFVERVLEGKINLEKCECLAFDSNGKIEWSKVSNVYRHKPNTKIYKITTKSGKEIKTTGYHSLFSLKENKIRPVIVEDLKKDCTILLPSYMPSQENLKEIDLTEFFKDEAENYSVTNIKNVLKRINKDISYREIAKLFGVSRKKALSYFDKDSMPLSKFLIIKNYTEENDGLKIKCRVRGSTSKLNSKIKLEKPFVKILSYIIADGYISNSKYRRYISIFPFDDKLAEEILNYCKMLEVKASYHKKRGEITISNFILMRVILKLVKGEHSRTKQIPNLVFSLPFEEKLNFLAAYINSDGCVSKTKATIEISSVNKNIINSLSYLCLSLGIPFSIKLFERDINLKGRVYKNHKIFKLILKSIRIKSEIYSNLILFGDKQERLMEKLSGNQKLICKQKYFGDLLLDEILDVKILEPDNFVYDLEVPRKQNFICGFGGICAHNTQMAGGQSIDCFNVWLAPFAKGLSDNEIKQSVQEFIYELNQSYVARGGQVVFSNLDWEFGIPDWLKNVPAIGPGGKEMGVYGDYEEESMKILREYVKIKIKGDHTGKQHMWPNDVYKVRADTFQKYPEELALIHEFIVKYGTPYIANGLPEWQTENFNYMGCLSADTPLPYINDNSNHLSSIGNLAERYFEKFGTKNYGVSIYTEPEKLSVFSWNPETNNIEKKKVLKIIKNPPAGLLEIKTTKGKKIKVTAEHPFFRIARNKYWLKKPEQVNAQELKEGDRIIVPMKLPLFENINLEIDAYSELLGFFIGDGTILNEGKGKPIIMFNFKADSDHLPYLKEVCKRLNINLEVNKTYHSRDKVDYVNCYIKDKELCEKFLTFYSKGKKVPDEVFNGKDSILGFLAGIINSDGYVRIVKKSKTKAIELLITTTLENVCNSLTLMLSALGVDYSIRKQEHPGKKCKLPAYRISLFGKNAEWLLSKIPLATRHKKKEFPHVENKNNKTIKSVKILDILPVNSNEPVYDLEVEGNHTFISGQGLFIHSNCRTRLDAGYAGPWGTLRTGNDIYITLNLPRIAYEARGNDDKFFELLNRRLEKMAEVLVIKHKISDDLLHKQNLLRFLSQKFGDEEYYQFMNTTKTFGYVGLTEALSYHLGSHLHETKEAQDFGLKIIKRIREYAGECTKKYGLRFSVIASPAETCAARLAKLDISKFGRNVIFSGTREAPYYTNSHMVKMDANIPLGEKIKIEQDYHPITNGGHILHIWLGEQAPSAESLLELTKKICKTDTGFFAYTRDYSVCNNCSTFQYGLKEKCSNCSSEDLSRYSRITGYYQRVEGWNPSKKQELKDRFRYNAPACNCD